MKRIFIIVSFLLASVSAGLRFDDELREFAEYIKQQMPCGFPSYGIPPLAPYTKDFKAFNLTNHGVDLTGNLTNLNVAGLNDIEIRELTFATVLMRLKFDLTFKEVKIFSQYMANGGLHLLGLPVPLTGNGNLNFDLENIRFNGSFRLRPNTSNGLQIWGFHCDLQVDGVKSYTTGIMNSPLFSKIFNEWVEEFFNILWQDYQTEINNRVGEHIVQRVNGLLTNLSLTELFGLILGLGPNGGDLPLCEV